jgi:hypothetical protein
MVTGLAKAILDSLTFHKAHLQHAVIGYMDELFEYNIAVTNRDNENILEELGDRLFYTEALGHYDLLEEFAEFKFVAFSRDETHQLLCQTVKRHIFYEQELNIKTLSSVYKNLIKWIEYDASHIGKNLKDVQEHNMNKLWLGENARYKDLKYTDDRAKERADKVDGETYKHFDGHKPKNVSMGFKGKQDLNEAMKPNTESGFDNQESGFGLVE